VVLAQQILHRGLGGGSRVCEAVDEEPVVVADGESVGPWRPAEAEGVLPPLKVGRESRRRRIEGRGRRGELALGVAGLRLAGEAQPEEGQGGDAEERAGR
jgi:hypothetical protein